MRNPWNLKYRGRKDPPPQLDEDAFWGLVEKHRVEPVGDPVAAAVVDHTQALLEEMA